MTLYGFVQSWEIPARPLQTPSLYLSRIKFVFLLKMAFFSAKVCVRLPEDSDFL